MKTLSWIYDSTCSRLGRIVAVALVCAVAFVTMLVCIISEHRKANNMVRYDTHTSSIKQPHIVFILADDLGWHDIGYHDSEIVTPTIDWLAKDGVKLENYYVQPICSPTRSQLLTGRYQIHLGLQHGVIRPTFPKAVPLQFPTIAEKLREAGYSTHMVGKWHLGFYKKEYTPTYRGFDSFYGYLLGAEEYYTHSRCYGGFCGLDLRDNEQPVRNETHVYSTHLFTDKAQQVIRQHAQTNADKPLFLYLPYQAVHEPLQVPSKYTDRYSFIKDSNRRQYAGMVTCMDEGIRNVTETLKEQGFWDNTIVIFSTDNGGSVGHGANNWPLRGTKATLWEGGMRGVGFVHSPLLRYNSTISRALIHVSDWFPTLLHLAGMDTSAMQLDGYNAWPAISHGKSSSRSELLHNIDPLTRSTGPSHKGSPFDTTVRAALRKDKWKLITGNPGKGDWVKPPDEKELKMTYPSINENDVRYHMPKQNVWLFDIERDPLEKNDLSLKHPHIVEELLERLHYYDTISVPVQNPASDPQSDPAKHGGVWGPWMD